MFNIYFVKKILNVLLIFFLLTSNVYADIKGVGRCIGYLVNKFKTEGQSSLTESNLKWMKANNSTIQAVNKISNEQKNCIVPNQPIDPCLSGYSNYDAQLFTYYYEGLYIFKKDRYDKAARALNEIACGRL